MSNERIIKSVIFKYAALLAGIFILCCALWLKRKFGNVTLDQILYHFEFGYDSLLSGDSGFLLSYIKACVLPPVLITALVWFSQSAKNYKLSFSWIYRESVMVAFALRISCFNSLPDLFPAWHFRRRQH